MVRLERGLTVDERYDKKTFTFQYGQIRKFFR